MTARDPGRVTAGVRRAALLALAAALLAGACGAGAGAGSNSPGSEVVKVAATTTVLADLVAQVGGSRVGVTSIVPKGGEVHTFDPTPSDVERVVTSDLVVMNGLGLDAWLERLIADAGSDAAVVRLGEDLAGVEYLQVERPQGSEAADEDEAGHAYETVNPHVWLNPAYARQYVVRIAEALATVDPDGADAYREAAAAYEARLETLDAEARAAFAAVPEGRRRVIAFHDAFAYFAGAYGLEVVGTIVGSPGQDPSAGQVADLVSAIRASGVSAILSEAQFSDELSRTLADETGVTVVGDLYTDTLGDPPVDTYEGMIRRDVELVVAALGEQ